MEAHVNKATTTVTISTSSVEYLSGVKVGERIGKGHFGKVFKGEWSKTGSSKIEVALKSFKQGFEEIDAEEISILQ